MTKQNAKMSRRAVLYGVAGSAVMITSLRAQPRPASVQALLMQRFGTADIPEGGLVLDLPALAENGNSVPVTVSVDTPMTADSYVKTVSVFAPANPQPLVARYYLSPSSGRAEVSGRVRLADSQTLVAVAEMNDGTLLAATDLIVVTLAACIAPDGMQ